jgi:deoxyribonuclease V
MSYAAVVVLSFPDMQIIEVQRAAALTPFPYITGLLSFREAPVLLNAFAALHHEPDVLIFDGMGRAHPRRLGIAAHLGVWLDKPSIGCGKTHLLGTYAPLGEAAGSASLLIDRGEVIGTVLRTRTGVKPVFISVGHRADLNSAVDLVLRCTTRYRLPEPIRAAHHAAGQPWNA